MRKFLSLVLIFCICSTTYAKPFNNTGNVWLQPVSGGISQDNTPGIRQNFTRDLFSWSAGYSYKLDFPAWPRGMDADISLNYNNYSRDTASTTWYGWNLGISRIYRNARKGVDKLYTANEFVADGNELVEIQAESGVYFSKNANNLNRYTFTNGKWIVEDTSGNKLVYGSMDISRLSDPMSPSKVFAWMLDSITDQFGNRIEYSYIRDIGGNVLPKNIRYGFDVLGTPLYEIQFRLIDKTRSITSYRTQFELKSAKLLSEVVLMVSGVESRKYLLSYDSIDSAYSHLVSIQEKTSSTTLPAMKFSYGSGKDIHLLTNIDNGRGGIIGLSYTPSTGYKKDGVLTNGKLPILLMTLSKIDYTDSITGQKSFETFEYAGGNYYYDSKDLYGREYAGFYQTTVTDDTGNKQISYFHQSQTSSNGSILGEWQDHISKKGRAFREENYNGSGTLLTSKITKWTSVPKGNDRFLVTPSQITTILFQTGGLHTDMTEWYEYDGYGNLTRKIMYGLVSADVKTGEFTDMWDDRKEIQATYAMNADKNIFGLPWQTILLSGSGEIVAKNEKIYDSLSGGLVSSGLTTEDISWKDTDNVISNKYSYDSYGLPITTTDANGNVSSYEYDQYHLYPLSMKNPLRWGESYMYNYAVGKPGEILDANGMKTIISYDSFGRELSKSILISGESTPKTLTTQLYDDTVKPNQQIQTQFFDIAGQDSRKSYVYLDGFGNVIETRTEMLDADNYSVSKILYDTRGNKIMMTYPRTETGSLYTAIAPEEKGDSYAYDGLSRVVSQKNTGGEMKYIYDGLSTTILNQKNIPTKFSYDAFENLTSVTETNGGSNYTTEYRYSPDGKLAKLTDSMGNARSFSYDMLGRVLRMEDLHAPSSANFGTIQFTYDNNGNILTKTVQSGENIAKTYDSLNRVTLETYPNGTGTTNTAFTYDIGAFWTGRLVSVTKGNYSQNFAYNGLGQKVNETISYGSGSYAFGYSYDLAGAVTGIVFPDGKTQTNISSKWLAKSIVFDGQSILSDMTYNPAGKPLKMTYGNGVITDYAYDYENWYRFIGKQSKKADKRYQILGYVFDPVGNITMLKEEWQSELQKTVHYGYDDLNRLISANHSFTGGLIPINESYAYDSIGNITSGPAYQTATFGSDVIGTNPHALIQTENIAYMYDARGNLTDKTDSSSGSTNQYEYNLKNEMMSYNDINGKTEYEYDSTGRRISKTNTTTATQYVNKLLEIELARVNLQSLTLPNIRVASDTSSGSTTDSWMTNTGVTDSGATSTGSTDVWSGTVTDSGSTSTSTGTTDTWSGTMTDSGMTNSGTTTPPETSTGTITGSGETNTGITNTGATTESGTSNTWTTSGTTTSSGTSSTVTITPLKWSYYIYLGDEKIGTYENQSGSGKFIFHLDDHLGGSNLDTNVNGEVLQITDYLPYGKERFIQQNSDYKNKYWFIGKEKDNESGLNYVEARYYDSNLGRFVAQDPVFWEIGKTKRGNQALYDPQLFNSYSYARNNPVILKDPTGEFVETLWDVGNVVYDVGRAIKNVAEIGYEGIKYWYSSATNNVWLKAQALKWLKQDAWELGETALDIWVDTLATAIPFVPAGGSKVYRAAEKTWKWSSKVDKPDLAKILNEKLKSIIDRNYRAGAEYWNGSTADAIRYTKETWNLIKWSNHIQKWNDTLNWLTNLLKWGKLNEYETKVTNNIINDLKNALK